MLYDEIRRCVPATLDTHWAADALFTAYLRQMVLALAVQVGVFLGTAGKYVVGGLYQQEGVAYGDALLLGIALIGPEAKERKNPPSLLHRQHQP